MSKITEIFIAFIIAIPITIIVMAVMFSIPLWIGNFLEWKDNTFQKKESKKEFPIDDSDGFD